MDFQLSNLISSQLKAKKNFRYQNNNPKKLKAMRHFIFYLIILHAFICDNMIIEWNYFILIFSYVPCANIMVIKGRK